MAQMIRVGLVTNPVQEVPEKKTSTSLEFLETTSQILGIILSFISEMTSNLYSGVFELTFESWYVASILKFDSHKQD